MRLALTVVSPAARRQADVLVDADPGTPVATLAGELDRFLHAGAAPAPAPTCRPASHRRDRGQAAGRFADNNAGPGGHVLAFPGPRSPVPTAVYVDQVLVPPEQALGDSRIRPGCVVSLGDASGCMEPGAGRGRRDPGGRRPAAGSVHRLTLGEADIGSADPAHILIADPQLPAAALHVWVDAHGTCTVAPYDGVPAELDREPLDARATWSPGQQVTVGGTLLGLARTSVRTPRCTCRRTGRASTSTGRRGCCRRNGPPGSSCRARPPGRNGGPRRS